MKPTLVRTLSTVAVAGATLAACGRREAQTPAETQPAAVEAEGAQEHHEARIPENVRLSSAAIAFARSTAPAMPSFAGVRMISAPKAASIWRRSSDMSSGMVSAHL